MRAGQLRERLTIEHYENEDVDRAGQVQEKWKTFATVWGRIEEAGASETTRADQTQPVGTHTVTIRYREGVKSHMRICWKRGAVTRVFGIEGITGNERKEFMTLACREKQ